jgi:transcriptional regulator with XRE-family HTH domain
MPDLRSRFGNQLKRLREASGMTQDELATSIGRSTSFVSSLERGVDAPSFTTLERIAIALRVSVGELFDFRD